MEKVPLPERRLRGFAEAQVLAAGFALRAEVPALLRALPRPTRRSDARTRLDSQLKRVELTEPGVRPSQRQVDIHVRGAVTDIAAVEVGREDVEAGADTQQPEKDSSRSRSPWAVITGSSEAPALGR